MSTTDGDTDDFDVSGSDDTTDGFAPEIVFGTYSVLSPGVEIYIDGRPISAPAPD